MIRNHYPSVQKFQFFFFGFVFLQEPGFQLGIKLCLPTVEAQSPNHWTTREFPVSNYLKLISHIVFVSSKFFIFFPFVLVSFSFLFYLSKLTLASLGSCLMFEAYHEKRIKKAGRVHW